MKLKFDNYTKKRDYYLNAHRAASSALHLDHLRDAVFWTDVCLDLFLDFMASFKASLARLSQFETDSAQRMQASDAHIVTMKRLAQEAEDEATARDAELERMIQDAGDNPELRAHMVKLASDTQVSIAMRNQLFNDSLQAALEFKVSLSQLLNATVSLDRATHAAALENITKALFDVIYSAKNQKRIVSAVIALFNFAIGLTPLGTLVAALETAQSLFEARANEINAADAYLQELETYLLVTRTWCFITIILVDIMDNFAVRQRPLFMDEAGTELNARTDHMSVEWDIDTPVHVSNRNRPN